MSRFSHLRMGGAVGLFSQGCCEGQVGFQWSLQRRPQLEAGVGAQGAALVRFWLGEGAGDMSS